MNYTWGLFFIVRQKKSITDTILCFLIYSNLYYFTYNIYSRVIGDKMLLSKIIKNLKDVEIIGNANLDIKSVVIDSRVASAGSLYVCLSGGNQDGHDFARQAENYGAVAIIAQKRLDNCNATQIIVKDTRKALSKISAQFYGNVNKKMKIIGVIGTNGKTTTAHLIGSILNAVGVKCGVIGTLGSYYGETVIEKSLTTPDPLSLHKILAKMYENGYDTVVMEVSAHASYYDKLYGIDFYAGVFTNFSRDHLDFFGDMENYKKAKLKFFEYSNCKYIIANADDELGEFIARKYSGVITYGVENPADVFAMDLKAEKSQTSFILNLFDCVFNVKLNLLGKFNVYNALAAATTVSLIGVKPKKVVSALMCAKGASGRLEKVFEGDFSICIDYAHTPDGLEKVLNTLKPLVKGKLICVFGCGGNRDAGKRYEMGKISAKIADFTVITSDNPRFEEPMDIIMQIEKGVLSENKKYVIVQERFEAIEYAINIAKKGDLILIAGKGGEDYQEVLGIKRPYNDKDTVKDILRRKQS